MTVPKNQADAAREFESIRHELFPDWDEGQHWTVVCNHHADYPKQAGLCVPLRRILYVQPAPTLLRWRQVLVHEICHAITGSDHGEEFRQCLREAADRAAAAGDQPLAAAIAREIR